MEFDVTVESPKGTRNRYEVDRRTGRLRLDRTLFTATQYPEDYGFVEQTLGEDATPLDALVLIREPTFPGCQIRCRAFGMFRTHDARGPHPKVLCVPTADPRLAYLVDLPDLEPFHRLEIEHFFEIYRDLDPGRRSEDRRGVWADRAEAEAEVARSRQRAVDAARPVAS